MREKRREEEEKKKKRREEEKNQGIELVMNFCMNFGMNFCMDTCLGVWNTSFCVESLFGVVVWFGCGPQWRKNLYRENVGFKRDVVRFF